MGAKRPKSLVIYINETFRKQLNMIYAGGKTINFTHKAWRMQSVEGIKTAIIRSLLVLWFRGGVNQIKQETKQCHTVNPRKQRNSKLHVMMARSD